MFISKPLAIKEPIESMQNQHQHVLRFQAIKVLFILCNFFRHDAVK